MSKEKPTVRFVSQANIESCFCLVIFPNVLCYKQSTSYIFSHEELCCTLPNLSTDFIPGIGDAMYK